MVEFKLALSSLGYCISELTKILQQSNKVYRLTVKEWKESRSLSQNALQHVIYQDIAKYLIKNGRTDCNKDWVKLMLKNKYLGWEVKTITDVVTGEVCQREFLKETKKLDTGEAYHYTTQIIEWAESIGCRINIPEKCEYRTLTEQQNR